MVMHPAFHCFEQLSSLHHDMLTLWKILKLQIPAQNDKLVQKFTLILSRVDRIITEKVPLVEQKYVNKEAEIIRKEEVLKQEKKMNLSLSTTPGKLLVSGREGFNIAMNGIYKKGLKKHNNMPYFQNERTGWVIRFWRNRWMFDWRGLNSDETAGAVAVEDVRHPALVRKVWKVFDGTKWVQDSKITVQAIIDDTEISPRYQKRRPGKQERRSSSTFGDFFRALTGTITPVSQPEPKTIRRPGHRQRSSSVAWGSSVSHSSLNSKRQRTNSQIWDNGSTSSNPIRSYSFGGERKRKPSLLRHEEENLWDKENAENLQLEMMAEMNRLRSLTMEKRRPTALEELREGCTKTLREDSIDDEFSEPPQRSESIHEDGDDLSESVGGDDIDNQIPSRSWSGSSMGEFDHESDEEKQNVANLFREEESEDWDSHQSGVLQKEMIKEMARMSVQNLDVSPEERKQHAFFVERTLHEQTQTH